MCEPLHQGRRKLRDENKRTMQKYLCGADEITERDAKRSLHARSCGILRPDIIDVAVLVLETALIRVVVPLPGLPADELDESATQACCQRSQRRPDPGSECGVDEHAGDLNANRVAPEVRHKIGEVGLLLRCRLLLEGFVPPHGGDPVAL